MKALILGGTGFLGPYVVRYLCEMGHDVTIFHTGGHEPELPPQVRHVHGPSATVPLRGVPDELRRIAPDVVVHMAPNGARDAGLVMEAFKGVAGRVVSISSLDVYRAHGHLLRTEPGPPDHVPLTEDSPLRDKLYPYRREAPRGKADPERYIDDYDKILVERAVMSEPDLPGTVLRLARIHGPGDPQHRIFNHLKRMDDGRSAILLNIGMSKLRLSRAYVENATWAIALVTADPRAAGRIYNVAETECTSEEEWVRRIAAAAGWEGEIVAVPAVLLPVPYDTQHHSMVDSNRIRQELGYSEPVAQDEAMRRTIAWERANAPYAIEPSDFDYAAEDAILRELGHPAGDSL